MVSGPKEVVLVTGGARGIGRGIVERISTLDRGVIVNYRHSKQQAHDLVERMRNGGRCALACQADVSDLAAVQEMARQIRATWGRLDAVVHNACPPMTRSRFEESEWAEFEAHWLTQVKGGYNLIRTFLPELQASAGQIIFILSSSVLQQPPPQMASYVTAKYALMGLARSLGVELIKSGVRINMISPYATATDMLSDTPPRALQIMAETHPLRRLAKVEDTAAVVEFLLTADARYLHLVHIPVTGGIVS